METRFGAGVIVVTCLFALLACNKSGDMTGFATSQAAETAFYDAFAKGDIKAMMAVWDDAPDVAVIHPMGDQIVGTDLIRESWLGIFQNLPDIRFETSNVRLQRVDDLVIHTLHERMVLLDGQVPQRPVVSSNVYRLTNLGWRMIHHHASPIVTTRKPDEAE